MHTTILFLISIYSSYILFSMCILCIFRLLQRYPPSSAVASYPPQPIAPYPPQPHPQMGHPAAAPFQTQGFTPPTQDSVPQPNTPSSNVGISAVLL